MTKEEFLSGSKFRSVKTTAEIFVFEKSQIPHPEYIHGYITSCIGGINSHHAIVNKITDTQVTVSTVIMCKIVEVIFNLSDFELF